MPFRFDKFTIKAQEAVQAAVELAGSRGKPQVGQVHLQQAVLPVLHHVQQQLPQPSPPQPRCLQQLHHQQP